MAVDIEKIIADAKREAYEEGKKKGRASVYQEILDEACERTRNIGQEITVERALYLLGNEGTVDGSDEFMKAYWMAVDALKKSGVVCEKQKPYGAEDMVIVTAHKEKDISAKIRDEIWDEALDQDAYGDRDIAEGLNMAVEIIDKYTKGESE